MEQRHGQSHCPGIQVAEMLEDGTYRTIAEIAAEFQRLATDNF